MHERPCDFSCFCAQRGKGKHGEGGVEAGGGSQGAPAVATPPLGLLLACLFCLSVLNKISGAIY